MEIKISFVILGLYIRRDWKWKTRRKRLKVLVRERWGEDLERKKRFQVKFSGKTHGILLIKTDDQIPEANRLLSCSHCKGWI